MNVDTGDKKEETYARVNLEKEHELRYEVDHGLTATIQLTSGTAESFGTELGLDKKYKFTGSKGAIFTWHGCTLEVSSNARTYVANETPMIMYANLHTLLEDRRNSSKATGEDGPRCMLVGPTDAGKSSVSKILLGYAARRGHQPTFVDLDIGQGSITVPGVMAAAPVDRPIDIEEGLATAVPVAFFYGHVSLDVNPHLYKLQLNLLAASIAKRQTVVPEARASGVVINTCGWVDGLGYQLLLESIDSMKADVVCVIDHERLYNDLTQFYQSKKHIKILKLTKSGGVVTRPTIFRRQTRTNKIREYFYGASGDLCPHSLVVDFNDIVIYRVGGGPAAPSSALPIGAEPTTDPVQLTEVFPGNELLHSVLAMSHATSVDGILQRNIAGFLYVTDVSAERRKITFLAPCPGALPSRFLIFGTLKWLE